MARLVARSRAIIETNLRAVDDFFARRPDLASWTRPEGGSIGFPRLSEGALRGADAEALSGRLVSEAGIMIVPGSCFFADPAAFRLGFGRVSLPEDLAALEAWLDKSSR